MVTQIAADFSSRPVANALAAVDPDRSAGQRERVDLPVVANGERVRILRPWGGCSEARADPRDVGIHLRITQLRHLFSHLRVFLAADLDFLRDRNDGESGECGDGE